ncbi:ATP-binding protein [Kitasatospora aureofaciens]|uniref:ATP-binding protein n=1 Tax=Kitasatospora aureofaciens TaxID=1894 RepID=UPI0036F481E9
MTMTSTDVPRPEVCDRRDRRITMFVWPETQCVRSVRRAVKAILGYWGIAHLADDAELLTTELLTNAIRHTGGEQSVRVTIAAGQRWLSIDVRDCSASAPRPHRPTACEESGRGLLLIERIAGSWTYRFHPDGTKTVSCRLPL